MTFMPSEFIWVREREKKRSKTVQVLKNDVNFLKIDTEYNMQWP